MSWLASSRYPAAYTVSSGEPVEPTARGSGKPRVARKARRKLAVRRFSLPNRLSFWKISAHENSEKHKRMARTTRATQPVCWTRLLSSPAYKQTASSERIVFPPEKTAAHQRDARG